MPSSTSETMRLPLSGVNKTLALLPISTDWTEMALGNQLKFPSIRLPKAGNMHMVAATASVPVLSLSCQFSSWRTEYCFRVHSYYTPNCSVLTTRLMEFVMFYYHRVSVWSMIGREEFYFIPPSELLTILTKILKSPRRQSEDCILFH